MSPRRIWLADERRNLLCVLDITIVARLSRIFQCDEVYSIEWRSRWSSCSLYQSSVSLRSFGIHSTRPSLCLLSHAFVNQFEKMDRSKSSTSGGGINHKDIICGQPFEPTDVLQEIARLRRVPLELVKSKQEDAHELLCQLLSELHEEICSVLYPITPNRNGRKRHFSFKRHNRSGFFLHRRRTSREHGDSPSPGDQWRRKSGRLASSR